MRSFCKGWFLEGFLDGLGFRDVWLWEFFGAGFRFHISAKERGHGATQRQISTTFPSYPSNLRYPPCHGCRVTALRPKTCPLNPSLKELAGTPNELFLQEPLCICRGVTEEAQIVFEHPSIGSWVYKEPPWASRDLGVQLGFTWRIMGFSRWGYKEGKYVSNPN